MLASFLAPRKSESKGSKEKKAAHGTMDVNEKDQKTSATIMTDNKPPKVLFYVTKEIRLSGPIINLLKIHFIFIRTEK